MSIGTEEWISLRQAVVEVSAVYAEVLGKERGEVVGEAISAIDRRLTSGSVLARSQLWVLDISQTSGLQAIHQDHTETDIVSDYFWLTRSRSTETYCDDWVAGEFSFACDEPQAYGFALGLEVSRRGLPIIGGTDARAPHARTIKAMLEEKRGRPGKWDWEGAHCAIIAQANTPDGLPEGHGAQAAIGRMMLDWFRDNQPEHGTPASSEIGIRAARIAAAVGHNRK